MQSARVWTGDYNVLYAPPYHTDTIIRKFIGRLIYLYTAIAGFRNKSEHEGKSERDKPVFAEGIMQLPGSGNTGPLTHSFLGKEYLWNIFLKRIYIR